MFIGAALATLVTVHVPELKKTQLGLINLIFDPLLLLSLHLQRDSSSRGSVSCCNPPQKSWLWGCSSTTGSAACWLSKPLMSCRKLVSTRKALSIYQLELMTVDGNHCMRFSWWLCARVNECLRRERQNSDNLCHVCVHKPYQTTSENMKHISK